MRIELVADAKGHHIVLIPETDMERAFAMLAADRSTTSSVTRASYSPIGGTPGGEQAIIVTLTPNGQKDTSPKTVLTVEN